eukprot:scaffold131935_cov39-Attheya_sp.AAC.2
MFSHNISNRMLEHEHFFTTPDFRPTINVHDPRQRNHPDNFATRMNMGSVGLQGRGRMMASFALHT